jgi:hypothetical protein
MMELNHITLERSEWSWFGLVWFYGVERHFQQYFSYTCIVVVRFIGGGNGGPVENHRTVANH